MKNIAVSFILVSVLTGCAASGNGYHEYPKNQPHATLHGSDTGLGFSRTVMQMESIDGKPITFLWSSSDKFSIAPGSHIVKAYTYVKSGALTDGRQVSVNLRFNAVAGQDYSLQSKTNADKINVWIVDSRGHTVSPIVSADHLPLGATMLEVNDLPH